MPKNREEENCGKRPYDTIYDNDVVVLPFLPHDTSIIQKPVYNNTIY
jgi:hypothetical protein